MRHDPSPVRLTGPQQLTGQGAGDALAGAARHRRRGVLVAFASAVGAVMLSGCATGPGAAPSPATPDLKSAAGQLDAYMRVRGSGDGRPVYAAWWVTVFAAVPGERPREIFRLDGFNVGRFVRKDDGAVEWVSREVSYYRDPATGRILTEWANPFTGETNRVLPIANDPVNGRFPAPKAGEAGRFPFMQTGPDVILRMDVPLAYPNPLTPAEYPAESTGPLYVASEHFTFFAKAADLADPKIASVPTTYAWARTGPWLPWMRMGMRPGHLVYSGHGRKLMGFDELPADVREYTARNFPEYQQAPASYVTPNETSWTYYRKQVPSQKK